MLGPEDWVRAAQAALADSVELEQCGARAVLGGEANAPEV